MHAYLLLKTVHILAAMVFFGTGLGTAWYRLRADLSGDLRVMVWAQREVVRADWYFTVPSGILVPLSAVGMIVVGDLPWRATPWMLWGIAGYVTAGLFWLPAVWLQLELRRLAEEALAAGTPLSPRFRIYASAWALLGIPSFLAALFTIWIMVAKHVAVGG